MSNILKLIQQCVKKFWFYLKKFFFFCIFPLTNWKEFKYFLFVLDTKLDIVYTRMYLNLEHKLLDSKWFLKFESFVDVLILNIKKIYLKCFNKLNQFLLFKIIFFVIALPFSIISNFLSLLKTIKSKYIFWFNSLPLHWQMLIVWFSIIFLIFYFCPCINYLFSSSIKCAEPIYCDKNFKEVWKEYIVWGDVFSDISIYTYDPRIFFLTCKQSPQTIFVYKPMLHTPDFIQMIPYHLRFTDTFWVKPYISVYANTFHSSDMTKYYLTRWYISVYFRPWMEAIYFNLYPNLDYSYHLYLQRPTLWIVETYNSGRNPLFLSWSFFDMSLADSYIKSLKYTNTKIIFNFYDVHHVLIATHEFTHTFFDFFEWYMSENSNLPKEVWKTYFEGLYKELNINPSKVYENASNYKELVFNFEVKDSI